jgi:hypothetical protein
MTGKSTRSKTKWTTLSPPYEVGRDGFHWKDLMPDIYGWLAADYVRPLIYELVHMRTQDKVLPGWWNGQFWEGLRLKESDKVILWKRKEDELIF